MAQHADRQGWRSTRDPLNIRVRTGPDDRRGRPAHDPDGVIVGPGHLDLGNPIAYLAVEEGTPVYELDGERIPLHEPKRPRLLAVATRTRSNGHQAILARRLGAPKSLHWLAIDSSQLANRVAGTPSALSKRPTVRIKTAGALEDQT